MKKEDNNLQKNQENELSLDDIIENTKSSSNTDDISITNEDFSHNTNEMNTEKETQATFVDPFADISTNETEKSIGKQEENTPEIVTDMPKQENETTNTFIDPFNIPQNTETENPNKSTEHFIPSPSPDLQNNFDDIQKKKNNEPKMNIENNIKTDNSCPQDDTYQKTKKSRTWRLIPLFIVILLGLGLARMIRNKSDGTINVNDITNIWTIKTWNVNVTFTTWNIDTGDIIKDEDTNTDKPQTSQQNKDTKKLDDDYSINTKTNEIFYQKEIIKNADTKTFKALWNKYAKDKNTVYYEWQALKNIEPNKFKVINTNWNYELQWIIVTSKNLMKHLEKKSNREFLMTTIASVTNKNVNVKDQLTQASIYSMKNFEDDYEELNKLQRGDKMTDIQRAKFGVIFLYIKLIKSLKSDKIKMSIAKKELSYFLKNSDKIIKKYWAEQEKNNSINGNIWYDEYCVYNNWELFGCFLNKIFISETQID